MSTSAYVSSSRAFNATTLVPDDLKQFRTDLLTDAGATVYASMVDPTGVVGAGAAIQAACDALPPQGGRVLLPAGAINLDRAVVTGGKPICIEGAGKGVTTLYQSFTGVGITITQTSLFHRAIVRGLTFFANAASACAAGLAISHPVGVSSFPFSTCSLVDVDFNSTLAASTVGYPNTYATGGRLTGQWQSDVERCNGSGAPLIGATYSAAGTALFTVAKCFQVQFDRCTGTFFDGLVRQNDYCEGLTFSTCSTVGCNWVLVQDPAIALRSGLSLNGLWSTNGQFANYLGGWNLAHARNIMHAGNLVARFADSGATGWTGFAYTSCDGATHTGNNIAGGGAPSPSFPTATAINIGGTSSGIAFDRSNNIIACGIGVVLGASTTMCLIDVGIPAFVSPLSTFTDNGTDNQVSYRVAGSGAVSKTNQVAGYATGGQLFGVANGSLTADALWRAVTGNSAVTNYDGMRAVATLPNGSTITQLNGLAAYVRNLNPHTGGALGTGVAVGLFAAVTAETDGTDSYGGNVALSDVGATGTGTRTLHVFEGDLNIHATTTAAVGFILRGSSAAQPTLANGFVCDRLNIFVGAGAAKWNSGFVTTPGAAATALLVDVLVAFNQLTGEVCPANNPSQPIAFVSAGSDAVEHIGTIQFVTGNTFVVSGTGQVDLTLANGNLGVAAGYGLMVAGKQVVGARQVGWTPGTGATPNKGAMDYSAPTLATLAARVMALEQALLTSGTIGAS